MLCLFIIIGGDNYYIGEPNGFCFANTMTPPFIIIYEGMRG